MSDETALPDRQKYASAADYAYAALRREIVEGRFAPGRRQGKVPLTAPRGSCAALAVESERALNRRRNRAWHDAGVTKAAETRQKCCKKTLRRIFAETQARAAPHTLALTGLIENKP